MFQFPFLVSLLFFVCARARACLFCSGWLLEFPSLFPPLNMSFLGKIHMDDECGLQGDFLVTCTV